MSKERSIKITVTLTQEEKNQLTAILLSAKNAKGDYITLSHTIRAIIKFAFKKGWDKLEFEDSRIKDR